MQATPGATFIEYASPSKNGIWPVRKLQMTREAMFYLFLFYRISILNNY